MVDELARRLTLAHKDRQLAVRAATIRELAVLWPALDWARLDRTFPALLTSVGALVNRNRAVSASLAAEYLRAFRLTQGVSGFLEVKLAPAIEPSRLRTSLLVTSVIAAKASARGGATAQVAMHNALIQTSGSVSRMVLDAGRDTITATVRDDTRAKGWQRVIGGKGCDFCRMLADRGAVYGEDTAGFESHDHCACQAEPVYRT